VSQSVFDFSHRTALDRANFLISDSNALALGWIDRWPNWPSPALVLYGPPECGKTHLAHLWCERAAALLVSGPSLDAANLPALLAAPSCRIAVDDADRSPERLLLHLYNCCRERGGYLLTTAGGPPGSPGPWKIGLADLRSRLRAAVTVGIDMPDDTLLGAVLVKHFADRQLHVGPELISYLTSRIERSFAAAAAIVAKLDLEALASRQPIAIPLARKVLDAGRDHPLSAGNDAAVT
jgi:chromosomal replication initiation ATPase DnaA